MARKRKAFSGLAPVANIPWGVDLAEQMHSWATVNDSVVGDDEGVLFLLLGEEGVRESLVPVTV